MLLWFFKYTINCNYFLAAGPESCDLGKISYFCKEVFRMKDFFLKIKNWLKGLSFRTGVIVLVLCIPFYILSFAQMALPISAKTKGVLWVVLFGLAKTFQWGGITILGVEGLRRVKDYFRKRKSGAESFSEGSESFSEGSESFSEGSVSLSEASGNKEDTM